MRRPALALALAASATMPGLADPADDAAAAAVEALRSRQALDDSQVRQLSDDGVRIGTGTIGRGIGRDFDDTVPGYRGSAADPARPDIHERYDGDTLALEDEGVLLQFGGTNEAERMLDSAGDKRDSLVDVSVTRGVTPLDPDIGRIDTRGAGVAAEAQTAGAAVCAGGACPEPVREANNEYVDTVTQLEVLDSGAQSTQHSLRVFSGRHGECYYGLAVNCCAHRGNIAHIACSPHYHELRDQHRQGRCIPVRSWCSGIEIFGGCIGHTTWSVCCFGSRLARVIQEQGRVQLGKGWGTKHSTDCGGLTKEEFQRLDLSRMDLTEVTEDVLRRLNVPEGQEVVSGVNIASRAEELRRDILDAYD